METKIKSSKKSAFTLIELIIVVAIVAIMTAVLLVNQKTGTAPKYDVDTAAREMIALIHQQQTGATGGQQINGNNVCGMGVSWNADTVYTYYQNFLANSTSCDSTTNVKYGVVTGTTYKNVSITSPASGSVFLKLPFAGMTTGDNANPEIIVLTSKINTNATHTICVYADTIKDFSGNNGTCS